MYLLILESIGTSELILIAVVALIVFGPRKLPQMVKTIGKTMGEFRSATNEFKSTWAREAALEDEFVQQKTIAQPTLADGEKNISRVSTSDYTENAVASTAIIPPKVKTLSAEDAAKVFQNKEIQKKEFVESKVETEKAIPGKRDWL